MNPAQQSPWPLVGRDFVCSRCCDDKHRIRTFTYNRDGIIQHIRAMYCPTEAITYVHVFDEHPIEDL